MLAEPKCFPRRCRWFMGVKTLPNTDIPENAELYQVPYCQAFPNGIPAEIAYGHNDHTEPYPEDGGIRFEKE